MDEVVAPLLQEKALAPDTESTACCPAQTVGELTVTVGKGLTVTVVVTELLQPFVVPVTVYVVVFAGVTEYVAPELPPLHW